MTAWTGVVVHEKKNVRVKRTENADIAAKEEPITGAENERNSATAAAGVADHRRRRPGPAHPPQGGKRTDRGPFAHSLVHKPKNDYFTLLSCKHNR